MLCVCSVCGVDIACSTQGSTCADSVPVSGAADLFVSPQSDIGGTVTYASNTPWTGAFGDELPHQGDDAGDDAGDASDASDASDAGPAIANACSALIYGRVTSDQKGTLTFAITCVVAGGDKVLIELVLPDARPLTAGAVVMVPAAVFVTRGVQTCRFRTAESAALGGATATVESAIGGAAPPPSFVTPDFARRLRLSFHGAGPAVEPDVDASSSCIPPSEFGLDAELILSPESYKQAFDYGAGCTGTSPLPDVGPPLP